MMGADGEFIGPQPAIQRGTVSATQKAALHLPRRSADNILQSLQSTRQRRRSHTRPRACRHESHHRAARRNGRSPDGFGSAPWSSAGRRLSRRAESDRRRQRARRRTSHGQGPGISSVEARTWRRSSTCATDTAASCDEAGSAGLMKWSRGRATTRIGTSRRSTTSPR